jgi:hypothetical protein
MDNAVYETLLRVANADGAIRQSAENQLKELAVQPGTLFAIFFYMPAMTYTF